MSRLGWVLIELRLFASEEQRRASIIEGGKLVEEREKKGSLKSVSELANVAFKCSFFSNDGRVGIGNSDRLARVFFPSYGQGRIRVSPKLDPLM